LEFPLRRSKELGQAVASELASQISPISMGRSYAELVEKYGEENAQYLMEVSQSWAQKYQKGIIINQPFDEKLELNAKVNNICQQHGWAMDEIKGDLGLLQRFVNGDWASDDFLMVKPGEEVALTYNESIIASSPS
jgi:hypothetical protein